jgi:hypothetical protein
VKPNSRHSGICEFAHFLFCVFLYIFIESMFWGGIHWWASRNRVRSVPRVDDAYVGDTTCLTSVGSLSSSYLGAQLAGLAQAASNKNENML